MPAFQQRTNDLRKHGIALPADLSVLLCDRDQRKTFQLIYGLREIISGGCQWPINWAKVGPVTQLDLEHDECSN